MPGSGRARGAEMARPRTIGAPQQGALAFDDAALPTEARLALWLRRAGYGSLAALARDMGVHHTYPGKLLVARTEPMPPQWRAWLLERGCPAEVLGEEGQPAGVGPLDEYTRRV